MKGLLILIAHLLTTIAKLLGPGGARAIVTDSLLTKQQLLIFNRTRRRAPKKNALGSLSDGFLCSISDASPYSKSSGSYSTLNAVGITPIAPTAEISTALYIGWNIQTRSEMSFKRKI